LCAPNDHPSKREPSSSASTARREGGAAEESDAAVESMRSRGCLSAPCTTRREASAPCAAPSTSAEEMPCARRVATKENDGFMRAATRTCT